MSSKTEPKQTSLHLPQELIDRLDALVSPMDIDARTMGGSATRASVIRAAIVRGLGALEAKYFGESKQPATPWENRES